LRQRRSTSMACREYASASATCSQENRDEPEPYRFSHQRLSTLF